MADDISICTVAMHDGISKELFESLKTLETYSFENDGKSQSFYIITSSSDRIMLETDMRVYEKECNIKFLNRFSDFTDVYFDKYHVRIIELEEFVKNTNSKLYGSGHIDDGMLYIIPYRESSFTIPDDAIGGDINEESK